PTPLPHAPAPAHDAAPRPALVAGAHAPFLALLGNGRHLLEAGCGAGEDLRLFRQQGLTVTAFDASRAQAAAASRLCGQPVRVCRVEQMQSVVPYDGIWASGSLPCLPEHEIAPALGHLATLLKAGGPLYASFPHGKGEPLPRSGEYPLQTRLDEAGLRRLIAPLPFTLHHGWVGEDEVNGPWLHALLVRR
ncbi:class I SAM-dependent methyltransferase, partial [Aeromonas caviae]